MKRVAFGEVNGFSRKRVPVHVNGHAVHPVWPEYEALFADPFGNTGRRLLATAPTPTDVLAMEPTALAELIRKASRGRFGPARAEKVRQAAADSVGIRRGLDGARIGIRSLLSQLEALRTLRKELESQIVPLAEWLPAYLLTLPEADALRVVSLFGETDPIETFRTCAYRKPHPALVGRPMRGRAPRREPNRPTDARRNGL